MCVQSDTLLLADVFESFRNMSQNTLTWSCKISFRWKEVLEEEYINLFTDMQKQITSDRLW